ncbi:MAG: hypothetical protein IPJ77_21420 [Planctomycetes bacterium]|nr:hypothetical protein [Planctomycetota bacterium]
MPAWRALNLAQGGFTVPHALAVHDDGSGPQLFLAGIFTSFHGIATNCCARFDGSSWSAASLPAVNELWCLGEFDLGTGPELFGGGNGVHRRSNGAWTSLPSPPMLVRGLAVFDAGAGPELYAVGWTYPGGVFARFTGGAWSVVANSPTGSLSALAVFDDGSGPALFAGGQGFPAGGNPGADVVRWDGANLTAPAAQPDST